VVGVSAAVYDASTIKRVRRTNSQMQALRDAVYEIVSTNKPCSCRQVYYLGIGLLWNKDTRGKRNVYNSVVRELGLMRENGRIPFDWITDSTRYMRIPTMYDSTQDALTRVAEFYRRDLWALQPRRVEVWAESDSISGVIDSVTRGLGVGLFSCRGQASKTFAYSSAMTYREIGKPVNVLYVGDWDPSGLAINHSLNERLERYVDGAVSIVFDRIAVTPDDVRGLDLVTHEVNRGDGNYRRWVQHCQEFDLDPDLAIEVEAIPPPLLRERLERELYDLVTDADTWNATIAAEESEREIFARLAGDWSGGAL
jgi:hypothetical protein